MAYALSTLAGIIRDSDLEARLAALEAAAAEAKKMSISTRIKALERVLSPTTPDLLMAVFMAGQTPTGWTGAGHSLDRLPGESDSDFKGRALKDCGNCTQGRLIVARHWLKFYQDEVKR